jgi:hypothetical protein
VSKAFSAPIDIKTAKEESEWQNFVGWWLKSKISENDFVKKTLYMVKNKPFKFDMNYKLDRPDGSFMIMKA